MSMEKFIVEVVNNEIISQPVPYYEQEAPPCNLWGWAWYNYAIIIGFIVLLIIIAVKTSLNMPEQPESKTQSDEED